MAAAWWKAFLFPIWLPGSQKRPIVVQYNCNGQGDKDVRVPWGKWGHLEYRGKRGAQPARQGRKRAVGIRQWRRLDVPKMSEGMGNRLDTTPRHPYAQNTYHCVYHVQGSVVIFIIVIVSHVLLCLSVSGSYGSKKKNIFIHPLVYEKLCWAQ